MSHKRTRCRPRPLLAEYPSGRRPVTSGVTPQIDDVSLEFSDRQGRLRTLSTLWGITAARAGITCPTSRVVTHSRLRRRAPRALHNSVFPRLEQTRVSLPLTAPRTLLQPGFLHTLTVPRVEKDEPRISFFKQRQDLTSPQPDEQNGAP